MRVRLRADAKMAPAPVRRLHSAGGVVYRRRGKGFEVVLCGRARDGRWTLPKGGPNDGERDEETALREVYEETGLQAEIEADLGEIEYDFYLRAEGTHCIKSVRYFLMRAVAGDTAYHDHEHDQVAWFPLEEASHALTFPNESALIQRVVPLLRQSP
jgi:8-oxo-dGTP pyrophosphatase MutT (NUDIX family)